MHIQLNMTNLQNFEKSTEKNVFDEIWIWMENAPPKKLNTHSPDFAKLAESSAQTSFHLKQKHSKVWAHNCVLC